MDKFFDYLLLVFLILVMLLASSCSIEDELVSLLPPPALELDGRLPIDDNGYYHLELNQNTHQTIHRITGVIPDYEFYQEPMKVEWSSNLTWYLQNEWEVTTANPSSYVIDGKVSNVIGPVQTMVGDTLILVGTIREHLTTDTIKIVLE